MLVTGGASGIGEAVVHAFVDQGSKVGFVDIDKAAPASLRANLPSDATVHGETADLRDVDALKRAVAGRP